MGYQTVLALDVYGVDSHRRPSIGMHCARRQGRA
jgi:hypothetical protein